MTIGGMFESLKRRGFVADRKYEAGEISEKTGLQKQPDGSWRVPGQEKDYPEYKGKGQKAVDFLIRQKNGCVNGAFYRKDVGSIDIVYGEVHDPVKHTGYGLAHIIDKHGMNDVRKLGEAIEKGNLRNGTDGKLLIEHQDYRVVLSSEWKGKERKLVITGFTKLKKGNNPTVGAVKDYTAATSPKPTDTIARNAPEVKSIAEMWRMIKKEK